jgi:hypothetical protein
MSEETEIYTYDYSNIDGIISRVYMEYNNHNIEAFKDYNGEYIADIETKYDISDPENVNYRAFIGGERRKELFIKGAIYPENISTKKNSIPVVYNYDDAFIMGILSKKGKERTYDIYHPDDPKTILVGYHEDKSKIDIIDHIYDGNAEISEVVYNKPNDMEYPIIDVNLNSGLMQFFYPDALKSYDTFIDTTLEDFDMEYKIKTAQTPTNWNLKYKYDINGMVESVINEMESTQGTISTRFSIRRVNYTNSKYCDINIAYFRPFVSTIGGLIVSPTDKYILVEESAMIYDSVISEFSRKVSIVDSDLFFDVIEV